MFTWAGATPERVERAAGVLGGPEPTQNGVAPAHAVLTLRPALSGSQDFEKLLTLRRVS